MKVPSRLLSSVRKPIPSKNLCRCFDVIQRSVVIALHDHSTPDLTSILYHHTNHVQIFVLTMARIAPLPIAALILLLQYILYNIVRYVRSTLRPNSYPPGPSPLPVSGNLHQIPRLYSHLTLNRWAKEYGPITGLKFGPLNIVVLNSAPLVYDLLVKRAAGFNERRPPWVAGNHVLPEGRDNYTLYMTQEWSTALRTLTKNTLVGSGLANLVPMQKASGTRLVWSLFQHEKTKADGTTWTKVFEPWYVHQDLTILDAPRPFPLSLRHDIVN
jgi:hypothetical protein